MAFKKISISSLKHYLFSIGLCYLYNMLFTGDTVITETVKYSGTVLDEVTEWIRSPVGYLFHLFEGNFTCITDHAICARPKNIMVKIICYI